LAGSILALIIGAPSLGLAAPESFDRNGAFPAPSHMPPSRRDTTPFAQPPAPSAMPTQRIVAPAPAAIAEPAPAPIPAPAPLAAPAPAATPAPAAAPANAQATPSDLTNLDKTLAASDAQIVERLRDMMAGNKLEKRIERQPERKAIEAFYSSRGYAPLWIKDAMLTPRAKAVIAKLNGADVEGLDAVDYPIPDFAGASSAQALADAELALTLDVLNFARHLQIGRIAPTRVLVEVDYGNHTPDPADVLRRIADASNVDSAFESFNPPQAGFRQLKAKLAELRRAGDDSAGRIAEGAMLKPGMKDPRIPQLREKLGVAGNPNDITYDRKTAEAVARIQRANDMKPTAVLDNKIIKLINGPTRNDEVNTVLANMERWRWLPRDLGRAYVMVNVPDFTLKVVRDGAIVWRTKIVSGKPQTPTPLTSDPMEMVTVNPSWYVPQSIIQNELLPLYDKDPNIFQRMGLEVKKGTDGNINVVQPPGAANALGHIKFSFPNKFQVYLHDTPEKHLFAAEKRAFSHGCMRVENPTKFGEVILGMAMPGPQPNSDQLQRMYGQEEHIYKLINKPMVHLTYQTAYVDDGGKLVIRDDIYGFDARIHSILTTDERRIADVAPPVDPKRDVATLKSNQEILRRVERREAGNGNPFFFFERLFR
jgi:murein L,D-transpeptidase YcbB/YkuD